MNNEDLIKYIDHQRWLLNNGLFNDEIKNQLFLYGSIVHKEVQAVDLAIDPPNKKITYKIYVNSSLLKKISKFKVLSTSKGFFGMWRFKNLIQKEGNLNFQHVLGNFVRDYCGKDWVADVNILNISNYVEGIEGDNQEQGTPVPDKQPDGQ